MTFINAHNLSLSQTSLRFSFPLYINLLFLFGWLLMSSFNTDKIVLIRPGGTAG